MPPIAFRSEIYLATFTNSCTHVTLPVKGSYFCPVSNKTKMPTILLTTLKSIKFFPNSGVVIRGRTDMAELEGALVQLWCVCVRACVRCCALRPAGVGWLQIAEVTCGADKQVPSLTISWPAVTMWPPAVECRVFVAVRRNAQLDKPTVTRRTNGHCLGTFVGTNLKIEFMVLIEFSFYRNSSLCVLPLSVCLSFFL
jgi:hypothetical protein